MTVNAVGYKESSQMTLVVDIYAQAQKIRIGNKLYFGDDDSLVAEVIDNTTSRGRTLRFLFDGSYTDFRRKLRDLESEMITHISDGHK